MRYKDKKRIFWTVIAVITAILIGYKAGYYKGFAENSGDTVICK